MTRLLTIPVLVLTSAAMQAGSLQVTAVRAWSFPDITRVAIEVNGDFTYHWDRAHDPERIFFDLLGTVPQIDGRRLMNKEVGDKLVKRVRVAETKPGVTRIVLDLEVNAEFTASQLSNPARLILELRGPVTTITKAPPTPPLSVPGIVEPPVPVPAPAAEIKPVRQQLPTPPVVLPAAHSATVDASHSLTRALGLKVNRIVIDAGHGGHDQGTCGPGGLLEKDLVLDVALRVGKLVEERMNAEVIYTRGDDTFVPLQERTAIANRDHADLFLSIHANSSPVASVVGVETYYLNFTDSADSMNVAARENAVSQSSVFDLKDLIQKISLHDKLEESKQFAESVQSSMETFTAKSFPQVRNRGVRKAPFVVLIGASMPSVLAEVGFLTNRRQESLLAKTEYRQKLAEALYKGINRYTQTLSHFDVARQTSGNTDPLAERLNSR